MKCNLIDSDLTLQKQNNNKKNMIHRRQLLLLVQKSEMNICTKAVFQDSLSSFLIVNYFEALGC